MMNSLNILSLNSARKGLCSIPKKKRPSYLEQMLGESEPDICLLPGDDETLKLNAIRGYGQYIVPTHDGTVLLYDSSKVEMKQQDGIDFNAFGHLPGIDMDQLVCPQVKVWSPAPAQHVVKEFSMVSWKYSMYAEAKVDVETLTESLVTFSQRLAWQTGRPVLIGGEMAIDENSLTKIVKKLSKDNQELFLSAVEPEMSKLGYLRSNTKTALKDQRHLFMMDVIKCNGTVNRHNDIKCSTDNGVPVADCFIASKSLEMSEPKLLKRDQIIGREIKLKHVKQKHMQMPERTETTYMPARTNMQITEPPTMTYMPARTNMQMPEPPTMTYRPTHTSMHIPVRPPTHHGG